MESGGEPFVTGERTGIAPDGRQPFNVRVRRKTLLSDTLTRITFCGDDVALMARNGADQQIGLLFPDSFGRPPQLQAGPDWLERWQRMRRDERPPLRAFTLRDLRRNAGEFDVDFVLHGEFGPATTWAKLARRGEPLQVVAAALHGEGGGFDWRPPPNPAGILLICDEIALPATAAILEELSASASPPPTEVFIETAGPSDYIALPAVWQVGIKWLARRGAPAGTRMVEAARNAALPGAALATDAGDEDRAIFWRPDVARFGGPYAWVAGEAEAVREVRRVLVCERGLDRRALTTTAYWWLDGGDPALR